MNFATFDLNLLRVLDAIFREGSTVKAAARLGLSQSAVSGSLSRLRHALGDPLFVRQGNRLVATDYAAGLRDPVRQELERIEAMLSPVARFDPKTAEGTFRIAASDFFAEMLMPRLGELLLQKAPGIRAQLIDLVPQDYVASLERRNADLALIPDTTLPDWVRREELFRSPFHVIARRGNPGVEGLESGQVMPIDVFCTLHHVLFSPEGNIAAMGDAALAELGRQRRVAMTVPVFSGVCRVVRESDLIALVPAQLAADVSDAFGLQVFEPPMPIDPPLIIGTWHRRSDKAPLARWMRDQVFGLLRRLDL
ncbi:LysR family transcriptional regulator [Jannaschia seohaensis]|uniref:DNA-binding transcriptional LysR family regulator n=1 Tax=Jannaschia seohaensis TaxID=475081 RepID=A0A2Y9APH0_9RHOB|nr:LysR family transcriptional regulator [Jannaschia seohaensis]PWJ20237.1 DNA-binding transcriptional LysR family regulator [Jannaschia seohaensis]SSA44239.1 DNA-binding transcriptional regulator, LysR family [Jannaschia seohaensis]